jgi:hypothetical protein
MSTGGRKDKDDVTAEQPTPAPAPPAQPAPPTPPKVPYDERELSELATKASTFEQRQLEDKSGVLLVGDCPRCTHAMDAVVPIDEIVTIPAGAAVEKLGPPAEPKQAAKLEPFDQVIFCNCGFEHEGRPKDVAYGCGAFALIRVGPPS